MPQSPTLSIGEIEARIEVCTNRLVNLRKLVVPELHCQHLREHLDSTIKMSAEDAIKVVKKILRTEAI